MSEQQHTTQQRTTTEVEPLDQAGNELRKAIEELEKLPSSANGAALDGAVFKLWDAFTSYTYDDIKKLADREFAEMFDRITDLRLRRKLDAVGLKCALALFNQGIQNQLAGWGARRNALALRDWEPETVN